MKKGNLTLAILCASILSGCQTIYKPKTFISNNITNQKPYAFESNIQEFGTLSEWTDASAGGLQGGLIVNVMQNDINARYYADYSTIMSPLFKVINPKNFESKFNSSLGSKLNEFQWIDSESEDKKNYVKFYTTYYLNLELTRLLVSTDAYIYSDQINKETEEPILVYKNSFNYVSSDIGAPEEVKNELSYLKSKMNDEIESLKAGWSEYAKKKRLNHKKSISERNKKVRRIKQRYERVAILQARAKYWAHNDGELINKKLQEARTEISTLIGLGFQVRDAHPHGKIDKKDKAKRKPAVETLLLEGKRVYVRATEGKRNIGSYCSFDVDEQETFLTLAGSANLNNNLKAPRCMQTEMYRIRPFTISDYKKYQKLTSNT
ncbi:hypothetical protein ACFSJY_12770 [Thalassotalea euphylliae]|uniref:hypothetical protein n=1 Tax=Thalassotalea euphylliae TaxID=1655234 RepID=UPI003630D2C9